MYYSIFGILALVIHVIINIGDMRKSHELEDKPVHIRYRQFLRSLVVYYIADILWGLLYSLKIIPLAYFDTCMFFLTMGITVLLWMRYIVSFLNHRSLFSKVLTYSGAGIMAFQVVTIIYNLYDPIVFHFDEEGEYIPGRARYVMLALQVLLFAATAIYPLLRSMKTKRKERLHHIAVGLSGIVMTLFIILQTGDAFMPFYAMGCLVATCIIHTFVELDEKEERDRQLGSVKRMAYKDPLTNVKNNTAYIESKRSIDILLQDGTITEFGLVVFDLNNLKTINDTKGHDTGDKYIQKGCRLICNTFKHSPVFRIGGDEFIAFLEGEDYRNRILLIDTFNDRVESNIKNDGVVISAGLAIFDPDKDGDYDTIFERADRKMYERKNKLKNM
ncbi:MAG: GGDEF domain-containing protein [Lachnospiraceae bacterium]|nr:GGDEF domain-containing protein [Lachnospiraceae bacterium]